MTHKTEEKAQIGVIKLKLIDNDAPASSVPVKASRIAASDVTSGVGRRVTCVTSAPVVAGAPRVASAPAVAGAPRVRGHTEICGRISKMFVATV